MRLLKPSLIILFLLFNFGLAYAQSNICPTTLNPNALCNPTGTGDIQTFLRTNLFPGIVAILGVATIFMIVFSGLRMILSQGQSEQLVKAKSNLKWSVGGFLVIVLAFVIVSMVSQFFGAGAPPDPNDQTGLNNPIASLTALELAGTIFNGIAAIVAILAILFIIISGFRYITAQGNEEQIESAKQGLLWAVIGLIIILLAYVIVAAALNLIGHDLSSTRGRMIIPGN